MVFFDELASMTLTVDQCKNIYEGDLTSMAIFFLIIYSITAIYTLWVLFMMIKYREFIKEEKLQKKYQEWKQLNKGLN